MESRLRRPLQVFPFGGPSTNQSERSVPIASHPKHPPPVPPPVIPGGSNSQAPQAASPRPHRPGSMCRRVTCDTCGKPSWAGCGMHVETVSSARRARVAHRCGPLRPRGAPGAELSPAPAASPIPRQRPCVHSAAAPWPLPPQLRARAGRAAPQPDWRARKRLALAHPPGSPPLHHAPGRRWRACRRRTAASASPARRRSRTRQASDKVGAGAAGAAPCLRHPCRLSAAHCLQTPTTTPAPLCAPTNSPTDSCIPRRRQQQVCSPVSGTYY